MEDATTFSFTEKILAVPSSEVVRTAGVVVVVVVVVGGGEGGGGETQ